ncbi:MAG TPA: hypothetical protein VEO00_00640, partial [Actinomycetota bacterium]|nr:hypothetical protein [Actinomycetota bacterium]
LDLLGLPPMATDGVSRLPELWSGRPIPLHDVVAVDGNATRVAITRTPYKLVRTRAWAVLDGSFEPPGTSRLYRTDRPDEAVTEDPIAAELDRAVDAWMRAHGLPATMGLP